MRANVVDRERALALMREFPQLSDREIARQLGVGNKTVSRWRSSDQVSRELAVEYLTTSELLEQLCERGLSLSERRLRRWIDEGVIGSDAYTRRYPGAGSKTIWYPGVVEQVLEADRLMRRYKNSRDVILGLLAYGYAIDEDVAQRAYAHFLLETRDGDLLVPLLGVEDGEDAKLRRRSLWPWRWALEGIVRQHGDIAALSAAARFERGLDLPGRPLLKDVLYDQLEATRLIFRGELDGSWKRDNFLNALEDPPPRDQLEELHRRLSFESVSEAVKAAEAIELHATAFGMHILLGKTADLAFERAQCEQGWRDELTPEWHQLYHEILDEDPLIPARLVPFFLAVQPSEPLQPMIGAWIAEAAMLFPDWRVMLAVLFTWPQLASAGWRATAQTVESGGATA
jgi:hypothetical protein